ncbi:hypothetical protein FOMPIDRAFT_94169 [Fomitopsis schrenkii]|uniref:Uncharacterized protein n=1 Tax=Fomitopsis schrenkii TaxID=2126942 RepID=S8DG58_FOMSC|nr:hypothetical protein FOMPIDRAFT_94169 [Fomitopsis schrenkii]
MLQPALLRSKKRWALCVLRSLVVKPAELQNLTLKDVQGALQETRHMARIASHCGP